MAGALASPLTFPSMLLRAEGLETTSPPLLILASLYDFHPEPEV